MPEEPSDQPLNDAETADVLRYWLGSMRYQEALAARPKAQRIEPGAADGAAVSPNLVQPAPGRKYMKLDWTGREAFVCARRGHVELALDAEAKGLFEDWLWGHYRRGGDDDTPRVGHLLSFPSLLSTRGELAGLLRCPLELSWRASGGSDFTPPTPAERAASKLPEPPASCRLVHGARDDDDVLPFFVDGRVLADLLRIDAERLDEFFAGVGRRTRVAPRRLVAALTALLEAQVRDDGAELGVPARPAASAGPANSARVLRELYSAVAQRLAQLGSRTRVYPLALVVASDASRVTAHAQRDIEVALERLTDRALKRDSPLSRYLRGQPSREASPRTVSCLGRFAASGLTPHQRSALEASLERRLCAIQGPPGTGNTTLILNRVADALVRKVLPLCAGHAMDDAVLVVTSTNNAAVDNVTSALGSGLGGDRLPLALRAGSRDVTERVTSLDLETCVAWLERHKEPAAGELEALLDDFRRRHELARALRVAPDSAPGSGEAAGYDLFRCAERLREVWAAKNRSNLLNVLTLALRAAKVSRSLSNVLGSANKGGAWLRRLFPAFGCTLLSLGNVFPAEAGSVEQVIIDEAGQCHPGYAVSALLRAQTALVIGDVHQLEPVVGLSREDERRVLRSLGLGIALERLEPYRTHDEAGTSAQALADRAVAERPTLIDHFRCQPDIAAICERLCQYGLVVRTEPRTRASEAALLESAVTLVALGGEQRRHLGSWANDAEAREVVAWAQYLLARGIPADEIGVITPFRGQLDLLTRELGRMGIPLADAQRGPDSNLDLFMAPTRGLSLGTVHRFQGGERSIIVLSTAVTQTTSLRFVDQRVNLVNVAASRARDHLITVGHEPTLRAGRFTRALLADARRLERIS